MREVKEPEVRRAEIMEAALLLFMEKGYSNTATRDITDTVKISRGLLHYRFKNKEDILYCPVEQQSEPILRKLSAIARDKKTAVQKIRAFIEAAQIFAGSVMEETIKLQKILDLEQNRHLTDRFSHNLTENFAQIIEQGNPERAFHVDYPRETASFLMTGCVFVSSGVKAVPGRLGNPALGGRFSGASGRGAWRGHFCSGG